MGQTTTPPTFPEAYRTHIKPPAPKTRVQKAKAIIGEGIAWIIGIALGITWAWGAGYLAGL